MEHAPKPWEYQPGIDNDRSYQAFTWFLTLPPPRRVSLLAGQFQVSVVALGRWASQGYWYDRARAYDDDLARQRKSELDRVYQQSGADVAKQQLELVAIKNAIVGDQLDKLYRECIDRPESTRLKPVDIVRLRAEAFREERLVRGQPTDIIESEIDLSRLTDDELRAYEALVRKAHRAREDE